MNMPTSNPRITFTVSEELMKQIDEYRFKHRIRNQTQAIVSLINVGLASLSGDEPETVPQFSEEDIRIVQLFNSTEPLFQDVAVKIMQDNQVKIKENRA